MLADLTKLHTELLAFRRAIKREKPRTIAKKELLGTAAMLATHWLSDLSGKLASSSIDSKVRSEYDDGFRQLLKLTAPSNAKSRYVKTLDALLKGFRNNLILPVQSQPASIGSPYFAKIFSPSADALEDAYLAEAVGCAKHGFFRGAVVLGWSAAINRVHCTVEKIGFHKFNVVSAGMASQKKGRFKKFKTPENVGSISELRQVFDTKILWIIEGMQLVDSNQHTRLRSCFEMRCQCSHPGDAPLTELNLLSFFSDIKTIVLTNPTFTSVP